MRDRARTRRASSRCSCSSPRACASSASTSSRDGAARPSGGRDRVRARPTPRASRASSRSSARSTGGLGADHIFIAAGRHIERPGAHRGAHRARPGHASSTSARRRLDLPWNAYYDKELDVRFSRSYGPGRYDERYELDGIDYPAGYVRWTERRNLACFVDLVERGALPIDLLVSGVFPVERATEVYGQLADHTLDGIGYLFEYAGGCPRRRGRDRRSRPARRPSRRRAPRPRAGRRAGVARRLHRRRATTRRRCCCRTCKDDARVELARVATARSLSAVNAQRRFGFADAEHRRRHACSTTTASTSCSSPRATTRTRSSRVARSSGARPCSSRSRSRSRPSRWQRVLDVVEPHRQRPADGRLQPPLRAALHRDEGALRRGRRRRARRATSSTPGASEHGSWYSNEELEGSRFAGEGGHFIDTLSWWFDALPAQVYAVDGRERRRSRRHRRASTTTRSRRSATSPTATAGSRRRRSTRPPAAAARGSTTSRPRPVWSGRRRQRRSGRRCRSTRVSAPSSTSFLAAARERRPDAHLDRVARRDDARHARGAREPGDRPTCRAVTAERSRNGHRAAALVRGPRAAHVGGRGRAARARPGPAARVAAPPGAPRARPAAPPVERAPAAVSASGSIPRSRRRSRDAARAASARVGRRG